MRGGAQTDGKLSLRDEGPIQMSRDRLMAVVDRHIARLPALAKGHPTLIERRDPRRIAGSWPVRLRPSGFHDDHVHSHGWRSSVFQLGLPDGMSAPSNDDARAGWLALGSCRDLVPGLAPRRMIRPRPGPPILFPSIMWHGIRPFSDGERLTVAFDIARPKQIEVP